MTFMQFLVQIAAALPPDLSDELRQDLRARELARGRELAAAGHLERIWRIPGKQANVSVWRARDASELHELLVSLPLWPWTTVDVTALAEHPLDPTTDH